MSPVSEGYLCVVLTEQYKSDTIHISGNFAKGEVAVGFSLSVTKNHPFQQILKQEMLPSLRLFSLFGTVQQKIRNVSNKACCTAGLFKLSSYSWTDDHNRQLRDQNGSQKTLHHLPTIWRTELHAVVWTQ